MEKRELDKEYKDPDSNFRIVFVCAMWLTGFDVKTLSCLYLDKPLKAHTLMQTIARANRVASGKSNGLIIDYIGIVRALKKALNDYTKNLGTSSVSTDPTIDKEKLIEQIQSAVSAANKLLSQNGFYLDKLIQAKDFTKMALLRDGAEVISKNQENKKIFNTYAGEISRLIKYLDRTELSQTVRDQANAIMAIFRQLRSKRKHIDTTDLMIQINDIINENVVIENENNLKKEHRQFDVSKIDFDILAAEFSKIRHKNLMIEDLMDLVKKRLARMLATNPSRVDYYNRYMQIIEEYNSDQDYATIEKTFLDLMNLAKNMSDEEQRYVREGFSSDEELSIYDLLFSDNLSKEDIKKIKKMAIDLLQRIKNKISKMDHWTDKQETKASVDILIRDVLFAEIPDCMFDRLYVYRNVIFEHVYTHYRQVAY